MENFSIGASVSIFHFSFLFLLKPEILTWLSEGANSSKYMQDQSMERTSHRMIVQCDWYDVYREGADKFWITYKTPGDKGTHSYIHCQKQSDGEISVEPEHSDFTVEHHSPKHIGLSYSAGSLHFNSTFRAPSKEFVLHGKNKKVNCLDVTSGGLGLSCCENSSTVIVWETKTGQKRRELSGHVGDVYTAKFFPSGIVILSAGADMQLKIWSAETGSCAATLIGHKAGIHDLCFVERGRNIISCSSDGTTKLWDVSKQQCIHTYTATEPSGVINSCDIVKTESLDLGPSQENGQEVGTESKLLITGSESGKLVGYSLNSKQQLFEVASSHNTAVNCVRFVNDRCYAFGTDDGTISMYDLRKYSEPLKTFSEGRSSILDICRYKQGFLYSTKDGSAVYIDETFSNSYELTGPDCDACYRVVHAGNELFTSCRDGLIRVYDIS